MLYVGNTSIGINNKLYKDLARNSHFQSRFWVLEGVPYMFLDFLVKNIPYAPLPLPGLHIQGTPARAQLRQKVPLPLLPILLRLHPQ